MPVKFLKPTMLMIAGSNGAGKSTLFKKQIRVLFNAPFINADEVQKHELRDARVEASYKAAQIATERRNEFISQSKSFITESVFSHPSKIELIREAKKNGFRVWLYHVGIDNSKLLTDRVASRFASGGHNVPEDKILERNKRNGELIRNAVLIADAGLIFDNSMLNEFPKLCVSFNSGQIVHVERAIPRWIKQIYARELRDSGFDV